MQYPYNEQLGGEGDLLVNRNNKVFKTKLII